MTEEQKIRYLLLKEKAKTNSEIMRLEEDKLYSECITLLDKCSVLSIEDTRNVFLAFESNYPFSAFGNIDWSTFKGAIKIVEVSDLYELETKNDYYILWDREGLPCVRCDLYTILQHIDDVLAVSFDTWLLSVDGTEIVEFHHDGKITYGKL